MTEEKLSSLDRTVYVEGVRFNRREEEVEEFFVKNGCTDVIQMWLVMYVFILLCMLEV